MEEEFKCTFIFFRFCTEVNIIHFEISICTTLHLDTCTKGTVHTKKMQNMGSGMGKKRQPEVLRQLKKSVFKTLCHVQETGKDAIAMVQHNHLVHV